MNPLDYWRLCDELNIMQATLLIINLDPSSKDYCYCEDWKLHERPNGYEAAKTAISNALRKGTISGQHIPYYDYDINGNPIDEQPNTTDVEKSFVEVDSLREWLSNRGFRTGFFFPTTTDAPDIWIKITPDLHQSWQLLYVLGRQLPIPAKEAQSKL